MEKYIKDSNVLIVAAAGNDGCECLHVPAALPAVLAVGAMDDRGQILDFSNWGETYQTQGIVAPGENILGAKPGGGTVRLGGTSFATPIVSGVAALLLSQQVQQGEKPNPQQVRDALLASAIPCEADAVENSFRCLAGKLNISGAIHIVQQGAKMSESAETVVPAGCGCQGTQVSDAVIEEPDNAINSQKQIETDRGEVVPAGTAASLTPLATKSETYINPPSFSAQSTSSRQTAMPHQSSNFVTASQAPSELAGSNLVYALGTLGYDFGTEARRDSFKQLMPGLSIDNTIVPANPYDARQMVDYLGANLSEAKALIWTLNLELTPIYAIEPVGAFARDVYAILQELLGGQIAAEASNDYVERVSIPGVLSGRTVKLFSGQVVPVVEIYNARGLYGWKINSLVNAAIDTVRTQASQATENEAIRRTLRSFLNRIYYDLRNLGTTSQDRALNFSATNAFQAASTFAQAVGAGMELDSITVEKSPFCRLDSDCWDVKLKFFDPENSRRAKKVYRFTIDVSDIIPVTLGEVRTWATSY